MHTSSKFPPGKSALLWSGILACAIVSILATPARAQESSKQESGKPQNINQATNPLPDVPKPLVVDPKDAATLRNSPRNILKDQAAIWTSPFRLRASNIAGPAVLVLATTVAITTDHQAMSPSHFRDAALNRHAETASNGLVGALIALPPAIYGMGRLRHSPQAEETGILGSEAMIDGIAVNEVIKLLARRERPNVDSAKGKFFQTSVGSDSSFPSNHCVFAWSSAAVIASEYPDWRTQLAVYGMASGVSVSRIVARQHFPSDVLVSSAVGWMIGRYVFHRHQRSHERNFF